MVGFGGVLAEAIADVAFRLVPLERVDAEEMLDDLRRAGAARSVPGRAGRRPRRARATCSSVCRALARGPTRRRVGRREPADRRRRPAGRGRRAGRGRGMSAPSPEQLRARCSSRAASSSRARRATRASSASSRCTTSSRRATRARCTPRTAKAARSSGQPVSASVDDLPADAVVDLVFVCTPAAREPRSCSQACARAGSRAAFIDVGGLRRSGRRGRSGRARAGRARRTSSACCSPARTGRAWSRPRRRCARRSSRRTRRRGASRIASQSGNFVSSFLNYAVATGVGVSRAVSAGQRGRGRRPRLPRVLRRRRRRPRSRSRTSRGSADGRGVLRPVARGRPRASRSCC